MYALVRLLYILLAVWCVPVVVFTLPDLARATGAPQQAAAAAMALAATVIPYVFIRAVEKLVDFRIERTHELLAQIVDRGKI